jgi:DNA-binding Lrp family transcriptional regulator
VVVPRDRGEEGGGPSGGWTFLTSHAHVLVVIDQDPEIRLRDVAQAVGITERGAQRIVADLVDAGYLVRHRVGRRNQYEIDADLPMRHPLEHLHQVGELLAVFRSAGA